MKKLCCLTGLAFSLFLNASELPDPYATSPDLSFKVQVRSYEGTLPEAEAQSDYSLEFLPWLHFPLDHGKEVIFRPSVTFLVGKPVYNDETETFSTKNGFGDLAFDMLYAPPVKGPWMLAYGGYTSLPAATSSGLGNGRWTAGPSFWTGGMSQHQAAALLLNHQWDYAGWGSERVNLTTIQPVYSLLPGAGWQISSAPELSYDWHAEQWTLPLNLSVGKVLTLKGRPWKISLEFNHYLDKPEDFGPEWMLGLNFCPEVAESFSGVINDLLR